MEQKHHKIITQPIFEKRPEVTQLLPYLSIGNWLFAINSSLLASHGITHILTATERKLSADLQSSFTCCNIGLKDTSSETINIHFTEAFKFISG